ncbi:MAG: metallophosphoesterase family protein [bacterium]
MTILALADRPPKVSIKTTFSMYPIDLIITLGDFEQQDIRELVDVTTIPKIGVYGNHDSGLYFESLGIWNMHMATFELGGLTFGGFEGCVRYKDSTTAKMYTQEEAEEMMQGFPHVDVMIAHCPPYGVNDDPNDNAHVGYRALRTYCETMKPKYLLHGHTYPTEQNLVKKFGETEIIYVYQEKVVELLP